uniref:VP6 n=1 Tax=Skunk River virus TaxID=2488682 RepID=A0A3S8RBU7_9REOV|nr:VP6 [Skunk River virus]
MPRLILLAPGDIIADAADELKARSIDVKIDENGISKDFKDETNQNQEKASNADKEEGSISKRTNDGLGKRSKAYHEFPKCKRENDEEERREEPSTRPSVQKGKVHSGENGMRNDEVPDSGKASPAANERKACVLTKELSDAIKLRYQRDVQVVVPGADCTILKIGLRLLKTYGFDKDAMARQNDALTMLKREMKKNGASPIRSKNLDVITIESEEGLKDYVGGVEDGARGKALGSSVVLATNKKEFVRRANIMFTAPTGDVGWKEIAREATKILTYEHTYMIQRKVMRGES